MKKIISLVFVCLSCLLLLTGCNSINYEMRVNSNGTITESLYLPLSESYFMGKGVSNAQFAVIKASVIKTIQDEVEELKTSWETRVAENTNIKPEEKNLYKNAVDCQLYENSETLKLEFTFLSNGIRKAFFEIPETDVKTWTQRSFLTTNSYTSKQTDFAKTRSGQSLVAYFKSEFNLIVASVAPGVSLNEVEPRLVYTYVTPLRRLHSDADYNYVEVGEKGKEYYHCWEIDEDDLSRTITLYTTTANKEVWYVIILGATLITTAVMFTVYFYKKKKKKVNKV